MKGKYLITTDAWFYGPDGKQYKGAWGEVEIVSDDILGIKTNMRSSNWFARVGSSENHIIIAGCQIHYAIKCENKPATGDVDDYTIDAGIMKPYTRPVSYYIPE